MNEQQVLEIYPFVLSIRTDENKGTTYEQRVDNEVTSNRNPVEPSVAFRKWDELLAAEPDRAFLFINGHCASSPTMRDNLE